jgi:hypothetical protein
VAELDSFAKPEDMEERTEGIIPATRPFLDTALAAASRAIRDYCGWHIAPVVEQVQYVGGRDAVFLPTRRIAALVSVVNDGTTLDAGALDFDEDTGQVFGPRWSTRRRGLVITYRHGLDEVPSFLQDLTLQIAARALGSPLGVIREQSLASSITWTATAAGVAGGTVLMQHEQEALAAYRVGWHL